MLLEALNDKGYEAYTVGGAVRDLLLGKEAHDYDVTTSAKPDEIKAVASEQGWHIVEIQGTKFGVTLIVIHDVGYIDVDDRQIRNWDDSGYGDVTVKEILKFSINTGMVRIGLSTGGDILTEYATRYGFGKPTGIELPGEGTGILFNPKEMSRVDVATMACGKLTFSSTS